MLIDAEDFSKVCSPSKLGKRKGTLDYVNAALAAHQLALRRMAAMPVLPSEVGIWDLPGQFVAEDNNAPGKRKRFTNVSVLPRLFVAAR